MKSLITMLLPLLRFTQLIIIIITLYYTTTVYRNTIITITYYYYYVVVLSNNSVSVYRSKVLLVARTLPLRYQYGPRFMIKL